jgi:hypothetical protein
LCNGDPGGGSRGREGRQDVVRPARGSRRRLRPRPDGRRDKPTLGVVSEESERAKDEEHGVFYPRPDATYIINDQVERLFGILEASSKKCRRTLT